MIQVAPFQGELPKIADRVIPGNNATLAENCDLESRTLQASRQPASVTSLPSSTQSIFRHPLEGKWMRFTDANVNVVRSPLNDDVHTRIYWTRDDGFPRMSTYTLAFADENPPSSSYRLGIPAPSSAPSAANAEGEPPDGAVEIDASYTVTFVSEYGEEGPPPAAPNTASQLITRWEGASIELTNLPTPPSGPHNLVTKNIYRSETGGAFLYVATLPAAQTEFTDDIETEQLGMEIPSIDWDMPPPNLKGLMHIGNGIMAGFFDNTLCFSEAYRPHAWPVGYQLGFASNIVGIAPVSSGLIVVTEQGPWQVSGGSPAAMSQFKLDIALGAVSRRSVVDMGEYAIYASGEGLVAVGGNQAQIITQDIFTREQWQELNPESIIGFRWHEKYLAFYKQDDNTSAAFIIEPEFGVVRFDIPNIETAWMDETDGQIYLLQPNGEVLAWDQGEPGSYKWRSKVFTLPHRASLSVLKIDGLQSESNPCILTLWADDQKLLDELEVTSDQFIRLPPGRFRHWQFEITGSREVYSVQIAPAPAALR